MTRIHSLTSLPCRSLPFSSRTPEGPAVGRVTRCEGNDMTTKNPIISTSLGSSLSRHVGSLTIPSPFTSTRLRLVPARIVSSPHLSLVLPSRVVSLPPYHPPAPRDTTREENVEWCDKNPKGNKESWKSREMS